jgi:hypothetical protein
LTKKTEKTKLRKKNPIKKQEKAFSQVWFWFQKVKTDWAESVQPNLFNFKKKKKGYIREVSPNPKSLLIT